MLDRDVSTKAVLDNMARLKALRLARDAAASQPIATPGKPPAKAKKLQEKAPALSEWLAGQQRGRHRTDATPAQATRSFDR
ncbi:MAG: hypothetical protein KGL35_05350 [Bradyrhizobium sp.]|nr:hypothetical protein [Bradyrhizobium sp.]